MRPSGLPNLLRGSVRGRFIGGMTAALLPMVLLAAATLAFLHSATASLTEIAEEQAKEVHPVMHLQVTMLQVTTPVHNYLLDGDPQDRAAGLRAVATADDDARRAAALPFGHPEERSALRAVEDGWGRARTLALDILDQSSPAGGAGAASTMRRLDAELDAVVARLERIHELGDAEVAEQLRVAAQRRNASQALLAGTLAATAVVSLLVARALGRSIARPLATLEQSAERLAHGELDHRVALSNTDEFGHLAADFNGMAAAIEERERLLTHQAHHDPLTGLPNRRQFNDCIERALAHLARHGRPLAVLSLDINGFKAVNDGFGHATGDALLRAVAQRTKAHTRECDTVARIGGDEFAVLLEETGQDEAVATADRVAAALAEPFVVVGTELHVSAAVGIAVTATPCPAQKLLRDADLAMYAAKVDANSHCRVFEPGMHSAMLERLELDADLHRALAQGEFMLLYQPIVDLATGRVDGVEALLRWLHPRQGLLLPAKFLPLAEESSLIVPIGAWALTEACDWARRRQAAHPHEPPVYVSVNLSSRQLDDPGIVATVAEALAATGLDPALLVLEITESALSEDPESAAARLWEIKALGARIAVDDFGTGYSSLDHLQRYPIDVLKIDKTFVDGLGLRQEDSRLAHSIIVLADGLGLEVVAEGIERPEQAAELTSGGCQLGQGYLFAPPLPPGEIEDFIARAAPVSSGAGTAT